MGTSTSTDVSVAGAVETTPVVLTAVAATAAAPLVLSDDEGVKWRQPAGTATSGLDIAMTKLTADSGAGTVAYIG